MICPRVPPATVQPGGQRLTLEEGVNPFSGFLQRDALQFGQAFKRGLSSLGGTRRFPARRGRGAGFQSRRAASPRWRTSARCGSRLRRVDALAESIGDALEHGRGMGISSAARRRRIVSGL